MNRIGALVSSVRQSDRQPNRQTAGQTDRRTAGRTDSRAISLISSQWFNLGRADVCARLLRHSCAQIKRVNGFAALLFALINISLACLQARYRAAVSVFRSFGWSFSPSVCRPFSRSFGRLVGGSCSRLETAKRTRSGRSMMKAVASIQAERLCD